MDNLCVDITSWRVIHASPTKGSRDKKWVVKPVQMEKDETELFLFKESHKRHPAEFWSEIITHRIGELVGVPTPETHCTKFENTYAALIKFFLKIKDGKIIEDLVHGGDLILGKHPDFDRKKGETHNVFFVEEILRGQLKHLGLYEKFLSILVFDALIGNTDRHQDNWGIIAEVGGQKPSFRLAPAFDNSDSLGRELMEEKLDGFLKEDGVQLQRYLEKGLPHLRWSVDGRSLEWINHFELLKRLSEKWPSVADNVKAQTSFANEAIDRILDPLAETKVDNPKYQLSPKRLQLMKRIICMRRDMLKETFKLL